MKAGLAVENNIAKIRPSWEGEIVISTGSRLNQKITRFRDPKRPKRKLDNSNDFFYIELANRAKSTQCVNSKSKDEIEAASHEEENTL